MRRDLSYNKLTRLDRHTLSSLPGLTVLKVDTEPYTRFANNSNCNANLHVTSSGPILQFRVYVSDACNVPVKTAITDLL